MRIVSKTPPHRRRRIVAFVETARRLWATLARIPHRLEAETGAELFTPS
jgi:hypothetical protein